MTTEKSFTGFQGQKDLIQAIDHQFSQVFFSGILRLGQFYDILTGLGFKDKLGRQNLS